MSILDDMTAHPNGSSELAQLLWSIERSCEAIQRVMCDPGFSASHDAINKRYLALGEQTEQLAGFVGTESATEMMCNIYNSVTNPPDDTVSGDSVSNVLLGNETRKAIKSGENAEKVIE
jgi:hypothetical protein